MTDEEIIGYTVEVNKTHGSRNMAIYAIDVKKKTINIIEETTI